MAISTASADTPTRRLDKVSRFDVAYAGEKGAHLGELMRAGFPVSPGFVVGAPAYERFLAETGLGDRLTRVLARLDVDDSAALANAAAQAHAMIGAAPMPAPIEGAIRDAWEDLAQGSSAAVAVRSSSDGMAETFLNVRGADDVLAAVRRCWASVFSGGPIFYRAKRGARLADANVAVVVQLQIWATRAGVMFTVDPSTGNRDELVIEGAFGLGEAGASGRVSPDRYVVDKPLLAVVARDVRRKELAIDPRAGGGTVDRALGASEGMTPILDDAEVRDVADLGCRVERHYRAPQVIEWAIDRGGMLWLMQARPVPPVHGVDAPPGEAVVRGDGAASGSAAGPVRIVGEAGGGPALTTGYVLVTRMTTPESLPLMRRAAAIVTDAGDMSCHAATVSRELGIPCVVGTSLATRILRDGELVTVDADHGVVREGVSAAGSDARDR